ncbi:MAG: prepilin-type N-terminal cleavage/methylation domain-containing protein [Candidatus Manganitrophus sp. SB1]|nr:prepilin-type N-terminal cleavage/methylation domain-containing protein [Candidatus Manganitrophus morganii]
MSTREAEQGRNNGRREAKGGRRKGLKSFTPHASRSTLHAQSGFTLIEIMVSLAVLAIALTVLLGLRNRDIALSAYSGHLTEATLLARQRISEVSFAGFPDLGAREGDFGEEYPNYKWKEEVKQTPYEVVRELNLEVLWKEGGREESVRFTTFLFNARG